MWKRVACFLFGHWWHYEIPVDYYPTWRVCRRCHKEEHSDTITRLVWMKDPDFLFPVE